MTEAINPNLKHNHHHRLNGDAAMTSLIEFSQELSRIVEQVGQSVVAVHGRRFAASGIHWQAGLIVSSNESVNLEEKLRVTLPDGQTIEANVVGNDPTTDIVVLQLPQNCELALPLLMTHTPLAVGNVVLGLGRSIENGIFASLGVIQTLGASWRSSSGGVIDQLIRVDLNLRRNAAGGPLVNAQGEVIGFNTFGPRRSVLTIPASTINQVVKQLQQKGRIMRGYLGIGMQRILVPQALQLQLSIPNQWGLMLVSIDPQQAAEQAGMMLGDILITLNNQPIQDSQELQTILDPQSIGQTLTVGVIRGGELREFEVVVGER
jgi:S1-C subfamily serine protease